MGVHNFLKSCVGKLPEKQFILTLCYFFPNKNQGNKILESKLSTKLKPHLSLKAISKPKRYNEQNWNIDKVKKHSGTLGDLGEKGLKTEVVKESSYIFQLMSLK